MKKLLENFLELDLQINLIALQTAILGGVLAIVYYFTSYNSGLMAAIMGLLTNSLMLTQNYHGHNSTQRLFFGLVFSFVCSVMFALATIVSSSIIHSTLIIVFLIPLLSILSSHQLLKSFAFYLAYAFILGLGFSASSYLLAIKYGLFFGFGCLLLVSGGFIRLWLRKKLFHANESADFVKYKLISYPKKREAIFILILTIAVVFGNLISFLLHLSHGYWLPLTALLVMKNEHQITLKRVLERVIGTILGIIIAYAVLTKFSVLGLSLGIMVFFYLSIITLNKHYVAFCTSITLLVMDILFLAGEEKGILKTRLLETVIGVIVVVLASLVVKIWIDKVELKKNEN